MRCSPRSGSGARSPASTLQRSGRGRGTPLVPTAVVSTGGAAWTRRCSSLGPSTWLRLRCDGDEAADMLPSLRRCCSGRGRGGVAMFSLRQQRYNGERGGRGRAALLRPRCGGRERGALLALAAALVLWRPRCSGQAVDEALRSFRQRWFRRGAAWTRRCFSLGPSPWLRLQLRPRPRMRLRPRSRRVRPRSRPRLAAATEAMFFCPEANLRRRIFMPWGKFALYALVA